MDWKLALKIGGPPAIAAFVFYELIKLIITKSNLVGNNETVNYALICAIFLFCILFAYLAFNQVNKKDKEKEPKADNNVISNNIIEGNDIGADLNLGNNGSNIENNKLKNNKTKGSFNVGSK